MATNDFIPFCGTTTGTNLPTQSAYVADPNRAIGNQPGVASSKLNNKPLRQGTFVSSQLAQYVSNLMGVDTLDDGIAANFLAQLTSALLPIAPVYTKYTSGSSTYNLPYVFFITSGSATVGATYTNNGATFTVSATIASATKLEVTGNGAPLVAGTLTKASGTGDTTIAFLAVRAPQYIRVRAVGGGGGGAGSANGAANGGNGGNGGNTTFGSSLITANGGNAGSGSSVPTGGSGGTASLGSGPVGVVMTGNGGVSGLNGGTSDPYGVGGTGGAGVFGGAGRGGAAGVGTGQSGAAAVANSGAGGGGAASPSAAGAVGGGGGGAGGFIDALILSPSATSTWAVAVGAAGTAGTAGTSGAAGGAGSTGFVDILAVFQ